MSEYFLKSFRRFGRNINFKVDLSNYTTKTDLRNVTHVDTSGFALKTNLANLKAEVDKLDIDKLAPVPLDLSKLSDVVKNVVKKTVYETELENKIPDISNLATKTELTAVENKVPNVSRLATETESTAVEDKIPDISNFATKTALTNLSNTVRYISTLIKNSEYDTNIVEIENKYVRNTGFGSKLAQANVIIKRNYDAKIIELEKNVEKLQ